MAADTQSTTSLGLLLLPPELRNMVYQLVAADFKTTEKHLDEWTVLRACRMNHLAVLNRVCRQIYNETKDMLYCGLFRLLTDDAGIYRSDALKKETWANFNRVGGPDEESLDCLSKMRLVRCSVLLLLPGKVSNIHQNIESALKVVYALKESTALQRFDFILMVYGRYDVQLRLMGLLRAIIKDGVRMRRTMLQNQLDYASEALELAKREFIFGSWRHGQQ